MHTPHDHAHHHVHAPREAAGISLLRLSATVRLSIALSLSALIWLIVYLVAR
jgi:hypothetical protein